MLTIRQHRVINTVNALIEGRRDMRAEYDFSKMKGRKNPFARHISAGKGEEKEVTSVVETMVAMAYKEAKKNGEFTVPGLGKLVKVHRKARIGRNPATGAEIKIPAKTVAKFRLIDVN